MPGQFEAASGGTAWGEQGSMKKRVHLGERERPAAWMCVRRESKSGGWGAQEKAAVRRHGRLSAEGHTAAELVSAVSAWTRGGGGGLTG